MIIPATIIICPFCGNEKQKREVEKSKENVHVSELIYPSGQKIVKYCELYAKDKTFAVELMLVQCVDLFIYTEIPLEQIAATIKNGNFFKTMTKIINKELLFIKNSELIGSYKKNPISELIIKLYELHKKL